MLPFGVTIPATVPQGAEIPEGLMNNPEYVSNLMSLIVVILFNTSLRVSVVPCPSSGDTILPGQPLW
jgi:hypothetical protein